MLNLEGIRNLPTSETHLGVVGYPIAHSISPVFQNAALQSMALKSPEFASWRYHKIEAPVQALSEVVALGKTKGFRGMNLTIPHKVEVLQYLDHIDPVAEKMGAVNTLVYEDGDVTGHNTDGFGVVSAIREGLGVDVAGRPVVMIGAGGASRGACVQCLEEGCSELWVCNRSLGRLTELVERLKGLYPAGSIFGFQPGGECPVLSGDSVLINATSLGLKVEDPCPVESVVLEQVGFVYDMVYGRHVTSTVRQAKQLGKPAVDGLGMLIHQGARSLGLWTGKTVPIEVMKTAVQTHMGNTQA